MPRFVITISQMIDVEADSEEFAMQLVRRDPPYLNVSGFSISQGSGYEYKTRPRVTITKVYQRKERKVKNE